MGRNIISHAYNQLEGVSAPNGSPVHLHGRARGPTATNSGVRLTSNAFASVFGGVGAYFILTEFEGKHHPQHVLSLTSS